jgi:hypothetical protein
MAPIGSRDGCPFCRAVLAADDDELIAQQQCPRCGTPLWRLALPSGCVFYVRRPGQSVEEFLAELLGPRLGISRDEIASLLRDADSLDRVEFVLELDDVAGLHRPSTDP